MNRMLNKNATFATRFFLFSTTLITTFSIMSFGLANAAQDKEKAEQETTLEQHPPHEHGVASLTIALDANKLEIDLESPADNIFGFEYIPSNKEDKKKVKDAVSQLKNTTALFSIPDDAHCHLDQVSVSSAMLEKTHTDKNKPNKHQHTHNDVDASWAYTCQSGKQLSDITPHFFTVFPTGFKQLKVEWLTPTGASSSLITEDKTIKLNKQ